MRLWGTQQKKAVPFLFWNAKAKKVFKVCTHTGTWHAVQCTAALLPRCNHFLPHYAAHTKTQDYLPSHAHKPHRHTHARTHKYTRTYTYTYTHDSILSLDSAIPAPISLLCVDCILQTSISHSIHLPFSVWFIPSCHLPQASGWPVIQKKDVIKDFVFFFHFYLFHA